MTDEEREGLQDTANMWPKIGDKVFFIGGRVLDDLDDKLVGEPVHFSKHAWCEVSVLDVIMHFGVAYCSIALPNTDTGWVLTSDLRPIQQSRAIAGQRLSLNGVNLYDSIHPAAVPVDTIGGNYYAYNNKQCEALICICKSAADVEATPISEHCLGWVRYDQVRKVTEDINNA